MRGFRGGKIGAFSLIELLVVIFIIAMIAAILLSVFAQSRAKGRTATFINNSRQVGQAVLMYAQDNDETLPQNRFPGPKGMWKRPDRHYTWRAAVYPYVKNETVWLDPNAPEAWNEMTGAALSSSDSWVGDVEADVSMTFVDQQAKKYHGFSNIAYNGTVFNEENNAIPYPARKLSYFQHPAQTFLLTGTRGIFADAGVSGLTIWNDRYWDHGGILAFWHNRGGVYTFVDGHTKWYRMADTIRPVFLWDPSVPQTDRVVQSALDTMPAVYR